MLTPKLVVAATAVFVLVTTPLFGRATAGAAATPTITKISPAFGPAPGHTRVTITGTDFNHPGGIVVRFGSTVAASTFASVANELIATAPPGTGTVDITVTTDAGTSPTGAQDRFSYGPTVTAIAPAWGPPGANTQVTITGTNFTNKGGGIVVRFGATVANFTLISERQLIAISPPGTGSVDVTVVTGGGTSPIATKDLFSYAPTITAITPAWGAPDGHTQVAITGTNFTNKDGAIVVRFGSTIAASTLVTATQLTATSPPGNGIVDVTVVTGGGTSPTNAKDLFSYAPTIAAVTPAWGPPSGRTIVAVRGTNFTTKGGGTVVRFGSTIATSTVVSATQLTAISPPGNGIVDITATTDGSTSPTNGKDLFSYAPTITAITPTSGPAAGETTVTVSGTNFTNKGGGTVVRFGSTVATSTVVSPRRLTAISPPGTGTVDITATTDGGTSPTGPKDVFVYGPTITAVAPGLGPSTGRTQVTISGSGFTGATAVAFGTATATFTVDSDTQITATSPPGSATVDVTVTTPGGVSPTAASQDQFTYLPAPVVSLLTPAAGASAGGTQVTISGSGFTGATAVAFGTATATFTVDSDTQITATSPPGNATVDVTVTTDGGTSPTGPQNQFSYRPAPAVVSISPSSGPIAGGTQVTITGAGFTDATAVAFGTVAATFTVDSDTQITATSPPGNATRNITVTTDGGTSPTGPQDVYTYFFSVPPFVTHVDCDTGCNAHGNDAGGDTVIIIGVGFGGATEVDFGINNPATFHVDSETRITAISPPPLPGQATVHVTVSTPLGTSTQTENDLWFYNF